MSRKCDICGKGQITGHAVSHSNKHNKRAWAPNTKQIKAIVDGSPKKITVCTRCLRSGKVERAI